MWGDRPKVGMNEMRKKTKFMLLSVPPGVWKALDDETVKRRGPMGRLEIQEVAIELLEESLNDFGDDELIQFRKLQSISQNTEDPQ